MLLALLQLPGPQNTMSPHGPAAHDISTLAWIVLVTFLVVTFIMWILIGWVALRRRGHFSDKPPVEPKGGHAWILIGGFLIPLVVLTTMFVLNLNTLAQFPVGMNADPPPEIRIIGHQWWWEIQYLVGPVQGHFTTANELHIPVGRDVDVELLTADVIHSFWVPELHGKLDMIPGQPNEIRLRADHAGIYRGQCAEFCGAQHAHMIILVVAQPEDQYQAWLAHQRAPASAPTNAEAQRGEQVFLSTACALCHTVRGTPAGGGVAPDLTHIASRMGLASNSFVNDTANLEAWVTHAQSLKPEVGMPDLTAYTGPEIQELVAYLQQLH